MSNSYILEVKKLKYNSDAKQDIDFKLGKSSVCALYCTDELESSKLLNCLGAFLPKFSGEILLDGTSFDNLCDYEISQKGLAIIFKENHILEEMTLLENILIGTQAKRKSKWWQPLVLLPRARREEYEAKRAVAKMLIDFGLGDFAFSKLKDLPQYIIKKAEIIRAIATNPKLIVIDNIFTGLSNDELSDLTQFLSKLNEDYKISILLCLSNITQAIEICSHSFVLENDGIKWSGKAKNLFANI